MTAFKLPQEAIDRLNAVLTDYRDGATAAEVGTKYNLPDKSAYYHFIWVLHQLDALPVRVRKIRGLSKDECVAFAEFLAQKKAAASKSEAA
jgi:hypothetical protein